MATPTLPVSHQTPATPTLPVSHQTPATPTLPVSHQTPASQSSQTQCSYWQSLVKGFNIISDVGFIAIPYAVKQGGWWSLPLLFLFVFIAYHTGMYIFRCLENCPTGRQTYPYIGEAAFGIAGRIAFYVIFYLGLYATSVQYAIVIHENMSKIFTLTIHVGVGHAFSIIGTIIILQNINFHRFFLVGGAGASFVVVLCLLWIKGHHNAGSPVSLHIANLPISIGIYSFCFSNHSALPQLYSSMEKPARFPRVLQVSFIACGILCILAAILGIQIFGKGVKSQFTLNMTPVFAVDTVAICLVVLLAMSKYASTLTSIAVSVEELVSWRWLRHAVSIAMRAALVLSTVVIAMKYPFFVSVLSFVGAGYGMLMGVFFPCACYFRMFRNGLTKSQKVACLGIAFSGVLITCAGTYSALTAMADEHPVLPPLGSIQQCVTEDFIHCFSPEHNFLEHEKDPSSPTLGH